MWKIRENWQTLSAGNGLHYYYIDSPFALFNENQSVLSLCTNIMKIKSLRKEKNNGVFLYPLFAFVLNFFYQDFKIDGNK